MTSTLLAKSAQGAGLLVLLQVGSRILTFIVNQILLRYLSPQCLGAASQLELFSVSILYFSRESVRVALQRQAKGHDQIQTAVRLSYVAIVLGIFLTLICQWLYQRNADAELLQVAYFAMSVRLYAIATVLELGHEPLFATAQQHLQYGVRVSSEMCAAVVRCLGTCAIVFWAHRQGLDLGVLPFAMGQVLHGITLVLGYAVQIGWPGWGGPGTLSRSLINLVAILYGQSMCKQLLTSGDAYLVALFTSLTSQGVYALAANYGGLLARLLFQPLEEASRLLFAQLLPPQSSKDQIRQAVEYLTTLLKSYSLLSLFMVVVAAPLTRPLLSLIAGPIWGTTEVPSVLAAYCWYIPLLAINGILEAYVSAVANSRQLKIQSTWMVGFSVLFAVVGYVVLGVYNLGARGLVISNATIMLGRICWSWRFVSQDLYSRGASLDLIQLQPRPATVAVTMVGMQIVTRYNNLTNPGISTIIRVCIVGLGIGLGVSILERRFLLEAYGMFKTGRSRQA